MNEHTDHAGDDVAAKKPATADRTFFTMGIVFLVLAVGLMAAGSSAWVAFLSIGVTFALVGALKLAGSPGSSRAAGEKPGPSPRDASG